MADPQIATVPELKLTNSSEFLAIDPMVFNVFLIHVYLNIFLFYLYLFVLFIHTYILFIYIFYLHFLFYFIYMTQPFPVRGRRSGASCSALPQYRVPL